MKELINNKINLYCELIYETYYSPDENIEGRICPFNQFMMDFKETASKTQTDTIIKGFNKWIVNTGMSMEQNFRDACSWFKANHALFPQNALVTCDYLGFT